jgi:hypothetical protein
MQGVHYSGVAAGLQKQGTIWALWLMSVIPALRRQRQEDQVQPGLHSETLSKK